MAIEKHHNKFDKEIKILWISDIHYAQHYQKNKSDSSKKGEGKLMSSEKKVKESILSNNAKSFESFRENFIELLKQNEHFENIDFILLSGDIAQSGVKGEYDLFIEHFLDPIFKLDKFRETRLLTVCGNHDVNRNVVEFLNHSDPKKFSKLSNPEGFLQAQFHEFKDSFIDYSEAFREFHAKFKNKLLPENISEDYRNDFLHGYFIDHDKKAIFILLNSSWYSFGSTIIEKYIGESMTFSLSDLNIANTENLINDILHSLSKLDHKKIYIKQEFKKLAESILELKSSEQIDEIIEDLSVRDLETMKNDTNSFSEIIFSKKNKKELIKEVEYLSQEYGKQSVGYKRFLLDTENLKKDIENYNDYLVIECFHHPTNWLSMETHRINYESNPFFENQECVDLLLTGHEHVPISFPYTFFNNNNSIAIPGGCFLEHQKSLDDFTNIKNWFSLLTVNTTKKTFEQRKFYAEKTKKDKIDWKEDVKNHVKQTDIKSRRTQKKFITHDRFKQIKIFSENQPKKLLEQFYKLDRKGVTLEIFDENFYFSDDICYKLVDNNFLDSLSLIDYKSLLLSGRFNAFMFSTLDMLYMDLTHHFSQTNDINNIKDKLDFKFDKKRHEFFSKLKDYEIIEAKNIKIVLNVIPYDQLIVF